jgi:transcriptional regulator of arginine metabolism
MAKETHTVLRTILAQGFRGTQKELCEELERHGVHLDQSAVSRALVRMGVVKRTMDGQKVYELPRQTGRTKLQTDRFHEMVVQVLANETLVLVKTLPGAAQFIAALVEHKLQRGILGTIAGDDTLIVIPTTVSEVQHLRQRLVEFLL